MKDCSIGLQILVFNKEQKDLLEIVDSVIALIVRSGLEYSVGAFETTFEGSYKECISLLNDCLQLAANKQADIFANVKIHYLKGQEILTIEQKTAKYN